MNPDASLESVLLPDVKEEVMVRNELLERDGWVSMKDESVQVVSETPQKDVPDQAFSRVARFLL